MVRISNEKNGIFGAFVTSLVVQLFHPFHSPANVLLSTYSIVIGSSFLTVFIDIPCHAGLLWGSDNLTVIQARERYLERRRREVAYLEQTSAGGGGAGGSSGAPRPQGAGETVATEGHGEAEDHPSDELGDVEGITMTTVPKTTTVATTPTTAIVEGGSPKVEDETPTNMREAVDAEYP
jgi:hypothetical protein